jgi:AcrR family transcriptional regulator
VATRKLPFKARISATERRALIERTGTELFAAKGYDAVSMAEVAAAADIAKATLYEHFPAKRDLFSHLLQSAAEEMVDHMARQVDGNYGDPVEHFRQSAIAFFKFVRERPFAWRMLFQAPPAEGELAPLARAIHARATANVATLLRQVEPSRSRLPERELLWRAEGLKAAQQALAARWYWRPEDTPEQLAEVIVGMAGLDATARARR